MSPHRPLALVLAALAPVALGGCLGVETTQDKSARKAKQVGRRLAAAQHGLRIGTLNAAVRVEDSAVVQDPNGVAAVVHVRNTGATQVSVPLAIAVQDATGKKLYANDVAGLDPSLVSLPVLSKGQDAYWVNNQILVAGRARKLDVKIGAAKRSGAAAVPRIVVSGVHVGRDADGVYAKGEVRNDSPVEQRRLTISCVAVAGHVVRAAGRAVVDKLAPAAQARKPTAFTVFFIGDPKDARLRCAAPPTVLGGGAAK